MKNIILISLSILLFTLNSTASDYPKTDLEKEMDDMGSLLGGEGVVFRPKKAKSTDTLAKIGNVNKYLYKAAIDVLKFAPLASADSKGGTVVTDWYSPDGENDTQFKINVYIKDELITPEALEVVAFQRNKVDGKWSNDHKKSSISSVIEDKIMRKARDLYLESKK